MSESQFFVGIDVAKAQLDIAVRPTGERWSAPNDAAGIATLVEGLKAAQTQKASFGLFGLTKNTRGVLELVRLDKVFKIFDDEEEAVRLLASTASKEPI